MQAQRRDAVCHVLVATPDFIVRAIRAARVGISGPG